MALSGMNPPEGGARAVDEHSWLQAASCQLPAQGLVGGERQAGAGGTYCPPGPPLYNGPLRVTS